MFNHSRKTTALALLTAVALTVGTIPSYAHGVTYCKEQARAAANSPASSGLLILPLAALGAGAGALVGVAVSGLAVTTGALVGGGAGTVAGAAGTTAAWQRDYKEAYAECRGQ